MSNHFPLYVVAGSFAVLWMIFFQLVRQHVADPLLARETDLYVGPEKTGTVYEEPVRGLSTYLLYHGVGSLVVHVVSWLKGGLCDSNPFETAVISLLLGVSGLLVAIVVPLTTELSDYSFAEFTSESGWMYVPRLKKWDGLTLDDCFGRRVYHFPSGERDPSCQQFETVEFCCAADRNPSDRLPFDWYSRDRFTGLVCFGYVIAHLPYLMVCWAYAAARKTAPPNE